MKEICEMLGTVFNMVGFSVPGITILAYLVSAAVVNKQRKRLLRLAMACTFEFFVLGFLYKSISQNVLGIDSCRPRSKRQYGMPSAHASSAIFNLVLVTYLSIRSRHPIFKFLSVAFSVLAFISILQRYTSLAHCGSQLLVGASIGLIQGLLLSSSGLL